MPFEAVLSPFQFDIFYHGTQDKNVKNIKKVGLKANNPAEGYEGADSEDYIEPGHPIGVYLANSIKSAENYGEAVFEVRLPSYSENSEIWNDNYGYSQDEYFPHDIPPQFLRQVR